MPTGKSVLSEIEICHSHFQRLFLTGWLGSSWSFFLFLLRIAGNGLEEAEDILPPPSDEIRPRAGRRPAIVAIALALPPSATEEKLSLAGGNFVKSGNKFWTMSQFGRRGGRTQETRVSGSVRLIQANRQHPLGVHVGT